jgi:hypothetical protein
VCRSSPRPPSCHMSSCGALSQDRAVRGDPARPGAAQFPVIRAPADPFDRNVAALEALEGPPRAVRGSGLAVTLATMTSDRKAGLRPAAPWRPSGAASVAAAAARGGPRAFSWDAHKRPSGRHRTAGAAGSFRPMQRFDDSARRHVGGLLAANNFDEFAGPVDGVRRPTGRLFSSRAKAC